MALSKLEAFAAYLVNITQNSIKSISHGVDNILGKGQENADK